MDCGKAIESRDMPGVQERMGSNPEDFFYTFSTLKFHNSGQS